MTRPNILEETPINMVELKDKLEMIKERDGELNFRANKTEEYLGQFINLDSKKAAELKEKLSKLKITRLKDEHIAKIVDLMPTTLNDVKVILQGYTVNIKNEDCKKIAETVKGYAAD